MKKTLKKESRIQSAKHWIRNYSGKNKVKGYSKKYGVDKLCAVKELRLIGVDIPVEYENKLRESLEATRKYRLAVKLKHENQSDPFGEFGRDENFSMIIGYTSGGAPYGITHEEMAKIEMEDELNNLP